MLNVLQCFLDPGFVLSLVGGDANYAVSHVMDVHQGKFSPRASKIVVREKREMTVETRTRHRIQPHNPPYFTTVKFGDMFGKD